MNTRCTVVAPRIYGASGLGGIMAENEELTEVQKLADYQPDKLIRGYRAIEEAVDALEAAHKAQVAPLKTKMQEIIGALGIIMRKTGQERIPCEDGTYYESTIKKVEVTDRENWLDWLHFDWDRRKDCLTQHVTKEEVIKHAGFAEIPGVEIEDYTSGHIRKS